MIRFSQTPTMWVHSSGISRSPSSVADVDALLWQAAVVTNGGTVSAARLGVVSNFIIAEKGSGAWALTDDYWGFWTESSIQALTSLKQRRLATIGAGTPTFTTDRDYTFDGVANYLNLGFIASTMAVAMTASNARLTVYERTNVAANTISAGALVSTGINLRTRPRTTGTTAIVEVQSSGGGGPTYTLPVGNSQGYTVGSCNGATAANCLGYKNGVLMTRTVDPTTFGASLPNIALFAGCFNNAGVPTSFRACSIGLIATGAALSAAQELSQYNAVQGWASAIGANV